MQKYPFVNNWHPLILLNSTNVYVLRIYFKMKKVIMFNINYLTQSLLLNVILNKQKKISMYLLIYNSNI